MAIVIMTVVSVSGFLYWHNDQQHRQALIRNNMVLIKLAGEYTILPLVFEDKTGAKEQLNKLLQDPRVAYIRLEDADGEIVTDYDPSNIAVGAPLFDADQEYLWRDNRIYFDIPITHNNQKLGTLKGAFRLDEYHRLQRTELAFILVAVLVAVIFSLLMSLLLRGFVMSSIQHLESHARRIAKQPGVDQLFSYPKRRNDEISQLYEAFNVLMEQVRSREEEILQLNADLEAKIKRRTDDLSAALRIKSAFLANMSHEIRTPMNAILGMHQLALETELTEKQRNYLTKANNAAKWLLGIINDVLDYSKLEAGKIRLERISFRLESIVHYLEDVAKPLLMNKPVNLHFSIGPEIPKTLLGDQLRIGQILLNLISNAVKFTEFGTITVQIALLNIANDRATLRFNVTDTGIGISEEKQQNLFKAFTQADSSTTRKFGGTGLGLAICKDLVKAMGGNITVQSRLGSGSCFSFTLDLGFISQASPDLELAPASIATQAKPLKGMYVLLVEDNQVNQELMLEVLSKHGLRVDLAQNGAEAITLVEKNPYDAVLMDCQMPVMDGFIATRTLRANPHFLDLPIIAMTANVMEEDRERCLASGMNDHIGKPIDWDRLFQILQHYWTNAKSSTERFEHQATAGERLDELDFPTFAMVDREIAQKIVSGNAVLYRKLLAVFQAKHANAMKTIECAYLSGDKKSAAQELHALSGALSAIGAMHLSSLMKKLQNEFNKEYSSAAFQPLLRQAEVDFKRLIDEIARLFP